MFTARQVIYSALDDGIIEGYSEDYAEPGYTLGDKVGILFANWNPQSFDKEATKEQRLMPRLADVAERAGYEVEWSDEWSTCYDCGKAYRTSPDSYCWQPSYADCDGAYLCAECLKPAEYLESIEGDPQRCNTFTHINPSDHGYVLIKKMANGWYGGQNDSPEIVARSLRAQGVDRFVFHLDSVGQFDTHFSVYVHETEAALLEPEVSK